MTTNRDAVFIDTNVLVHAKLARSPLHQVATERLKGLGEEGVSVWVSRQILREYLAAMTRPNTLTEPIPPALLVKDVRDFASRFEVAEDGPQVTEKLLALMEQIPIGGKQVHDANIVATMQAYGIRQLLTHNTDDFARFAHLIQVLPLVVSKEGASPSGNEAP